MSISSEWRRKLGEGKIPDKKLIVDNHNIDCGFHFDVLALAGYNNYTDF